MLSGFLILFREAPLFFSLLIEKEFVMKKYQKLFIGIIAICIIAVCIASASAAIPAVIPMKVVTKLAPKAKDFFAKTGKTVKKTSGGAAKVVWDNKGAIAVGTVATVALTNPEAVKAAVTGTADVAYGAVTGGKTANTVAPRANARPSTSSGSIFPTLPTLLFYLFVTVLVIAAVRYCLHSVGLRRVLPLMIVGVLLCCGGIVKAAVITPPPPVFPPVPWLTLLNIAVIVISIFI
jgi:hypothetical protein